MNVLVLTGLFTERACEKNANFVYHQVCAVAKQGISVDVLLATPWKPKQMNYLGFLHGRTGNGRGSESEPFRFHRAHFLSLPRNVLGLWANPIAAGCLIPKIRALATQRRIDLIHAHNEKMAYVAVAVGRELGIPIVVMIQGAYTGKRLLDPPAKRAQFSDTLRGAARVVLVGTSLLEYYRHLVDSARIEILSHGFWIPSSIVPSQRVPRVHEVRIVAAANLDLNKGLDDLLHAISYLTFEHGVSTEAVIVGDGTERSHLLKLAGQLGIIDRVTLTGQLLHPATIEEIAAGDIFCLPSWREACGLVYMEAMALGKPTVGCLGQGAGDLMRDCETGYLVQPRNVQALTKTLLDIVENPGRARQIADRGQKHAWADLTWDNNAAKLVRTYEDVLKSAVNQPLRTIPE